MNMIDRVVLALNNMPEWQCLDDPPSMELIARTGIKAVRDHLKTEDFTYAEAEAIRRFLDEALE